MPDSLEHNPFATRFTRPGALDYQFPSGQSADWAVAKLGAQGWWGAILGPHGVGKSTLLRTLAGALQSIGRQPVAFTLKKNQRVLSLSAAEVAAWDATTQVIVDGYEQLGWWGRWRLKSLCRRRGAGLLVTAHGPIDIAELLRMQPSLEMAQRVVARLLAQGTDSVAAEQTGKPVESNPAAVNVVIREADVAAAFERQHGNVRETLFELHDLYRRRSAASS